MNENTNLVKPDNNLVWSILCTVLCCLPLGIVAIIKSCSVDGLWASGQHEQAIAAAKSAKKFALWGAIGWVICVIAYVAFIAIFVGFSALSAESVTTTTTTSPF